MTFLVTYPHRSNSAKSGPNQCFFLDVYRYLRRVFYTFWNIPDLLIFKCFYLRSEKVSEEKSQGKNEYFGALRAAKKKEEREEKKLILIYYGRNIRGGIAPKARKILGALFWHFWHFFVVHFPTLFWKKKHWFKVRKSSGLDRKSAKIIEISRKSGEISEE